MSRPSDTVRVLGVRLLLVYIARLTQRAAGCAVWQARIIPSIEPPGTACKTASGDAYVLQRMHGGDSDLARARWASCACPCGALEERLHSSCDRLENCGSTCDTKAKKHLIPLLVESCRVNAARQVTVVVHAAGEHERGSYGARQRSKTSNFVVGTDFAKL